MRFAVLVAVLGLAAATVVGQAAPAKPEVTFCVLSHAGIHYNTMHAYHAATYFQPLYPNVTFKKRIIGVPKSDNPLAQSLAHALVASESSQGRCHMLIGPGWSSLCMALGLTVNSLWVESISTTTLINADNAPYFSRILPSDGESTKGALTLFDAFGWKKGNTICTDNGYGRSQLDGFAKGNVSVLVARCLPSGATEKDYDDYLLAVSASESRVVFVAMDSTNSMQLAHRAFVGGYHKRLVFVFSEASCAGTRQAYRLLPGSLCATYRRNEAVFDAFLQSFGNNATFWPLRVELQAALQAELETHPTNFGSSTYSAFAVDAVRFMMSAVNQWHQDHGFNASLPTPLAKELVAYARKQTFSGGITGNTIALDHTTGARVGAEFDVRQSTSAADGTTYPVPFPGKPAVNAPYHTSRTVAYSTFDGSMVQKPPYNWLAGPNTTSIVGFAVPLPSSPASKTWVYAGIVVGGILAVVLAVAVVFVVRHATRHRRCPKDGAQFTAFFVSVRNEAALRDADSDGAVAALQIVEKAARAAARRSGCHHATRLDAHHLFVAVDTDRALKCIASIQQELSAVSWPMPTARIHAAAAHMYETNSAAPSHSQRRTVGGAASTVKPASKGTTATSARSGQSGRSNGRLAKPLKARVSIGLWTGSGRVTFDAERDMYMYAGTAVECAAAMCDAAGNGEALIPATAADDAARLGAVAVDGTVDLPTGSRKAAADVAVFVATGADDLESLASSQYDTAGAKKTKAAAPVSNSSDETARSHRSLRHGGPRRAGAQAGGGGLAAALQSSDGGIAARRAGLVAALIPELRRGTAGPSAAWSPADLTRAMRTAASTVAAACGSCKAHIVGFDDGVFLCAVNVSEASMTATPATRAAQLAVRIVNAMNGAPETAVSGDPMAASRSDAVVPVLHAHCGVAVGAAAVGPLDPSKALPKRIESAGPALPAVLAQGVSVQGGLAEKARHLAHFAEALSEGALTTCPHDEIVHAIVTRALDVVAWPAMGNGTPAAAPPSTSRPVPLSSVLAEVSDVAEGEWLYQLDGISRNPNAGVNAAIAALLQGNVDLAVTELSNAQDSADSGSGKATAARIREVVEDVRGCLPDAKSDPTTSVGAGAIRLYAQRRTNTLLKAFPDV